jgi:hypothetical protein
MVVSLDLALLQKSGTTLLVRFYGFRKRKYYA